MGMPLPVGLALVICESFARCPNGNLNLGGVLNRIESDAFPLLLPRLCVYLALTDIRPRCQCKIDIIDGESDEPILSGIEFEAPQVQQAMGTGVCEIAIDFAPFPFSRPGVYLVRLFANEQMLLQRSIVVEKSESSRESDV
jgi:hypothetical protein